MWKTPAYNHRFDTEFYSYPLSTQWYIWVSDYAPDWIRWLYRKVDNAKWWIFHRVHPGHRYHILNTGLGYGWRDRDTVMEAIMIKCIIDFVELERPFDHFDVTYHTEIWVEIYQIYEFFKLNDFRHLESEVLTPWLNRIVAIRGHLWT